MGGSMRLVATPGRRTFSGAVVASCLLGATAAFGWVPATAQTATAETTAVGAESCPPAWPALRGGSPADQFDGSPSVLVGGNLTVGGGAVGAEGIVVTRGNATFELGAPGAYRIGSTATGSQIAPHPGSDMLVVGGNVIGSPTTLLDIGQGLGGDAVLAGTLGDGSLLDLHEGTVADQVADATAPYAGLLDGLSAKSGAYAALASNGSVEITDKAITLIGDGTSPTQTFTIDGKDLAARQDHDRSLQLVSVPDDAVVVVNLTGPTVALDIDSLLLPGGDVVDPTADPYFAQLATRLLWNVPGATTVDLGGEAQLPGSLLVGSAGSTTTLDGAGTNGRVFVAGDLQHRGGELHSYPLLSDPDLACGPARQHLASLTLTLDVDDPGQVLRKDPYFDGSFTCILGGVDVTPGDGVWRLRATGQPEVLSAAVPVGSLCFVDQKLDGSPPTGWQWTEPTIFPAKVAIVKRQTSGFAVSNKLQQVKSPPTTSDPEPEPTTDPTPEPEPTTDPTPDPVEPEPVQPVDPVEPTVPTVPEPEVPSIPNDDPTTSPDDPLSPTGSDPDGDDSSADGDDDTVVADPPRSPGTAGPLTTTAPYTLRGAFVWGPLLLISVLAMRLRFPWRPRKRNQDYYSLP